FEAPGPRLQAYAPPSAYFLKRRGGRERPPAAGAAAGRVLAPRFGAAARDSRAMAHGGFREGQAAQLLSLSHET
ncbi:MAG: hypothetical protein CFK52_06010, partial [Chloracidobacterium sp. CP2_5A]